MTERTRASRLAEPRSVMVTRMVVIVAVAMSSWRAVWTRAARR